MKHPSHPDISKRLKRAYGHLASVIEMIDAGRSCTDLAQQLHAVESAITNAKRELIHDHMEHCLGDGVGSGDMTSGAALAEFKTLAKYL
ncbi:MAG: metal-sensing transcriptional repressor [Devosia sp.]